MEKIIVIPKTVFIDIERGKKSIIDNTLKLLYSMFEIYTQNVYFSIKTRDSIKYMDSIELVLSFDEPNQTECSQRETLKTCRTCGKNFESPHTCTGLWMK